MKYQIAVIGGDGIGPEITAGATTVLDRVAKNFGYEFSYTPVLAGGVAIDTFGEPLPRQSLEKCLASDSVLLGAVGGPKWDTLPSHLRPEKALLALRKELGLYANLRPATVYPQLADASPLKARVLEGGADIMVVRELTGGIYFGERGEDEQSAYDTERYSIAEVERIARRAFEIAALRRKRVVSVDKANILKSSQLWRQVVERVAKDYPDITLSHMYVDNAAMQLALHPTQFDVIVTSNMFGDILSDLASAITGSIGMLPSASIGDGNRGMYEPIHGSAPDIAGQDKANPLATILSAAMMLRTAFGLTQGADAIENAVSHVLSAGWRTADIAGGSLQIVGCKQMSKLVADAIES